MMHRKNLAAFTLMELSIVLVVIGLLSGGVVVGRHLIKAAEMNSIYRQMMGYEAARNTFFTKYNCLAGDCRNAAASGLGENGNGNGRLDVYTFGDELYQYWYQLAAAKLINGDYTGQSGPMGDEDYVIGVNIPVTVRKNVGIGVLQLLPQPEYYIWAKRFGVEERIDTHFYTIGKDTGNWGNWGGAFSIVEMLSLDLKYDDGKVNSGRIRTHIGLKEVTNTYGCTVPSQLFLADVDATDIFDYGTDPDVRCAIWYLFWP